MDVQALVIAYGNCLRGDDGVGPAAGDAVLSWNMPGVRVLIVQQLVPELIEELKHAARVLFIDAARNVSGPYSSSIVQLQKSRRPLGHHETPANLLALLYDLEGRAPRAWLLSIAAVSFDHGQQLSNTAADNMNEALAWVRNWLLEYLLPMTGLYNQISLGG